MSDHPLCGYVFDAKALEAYSRGRMLADAPPPSAKGQDFFLWEIEQGLTGSVRRPHAQTIGDCVSQGTTGGAEDLQFVQMLRNPAFEFKMLSTEVMYSLARIQVGHGQCGYGDGAVVSWAFEAGQKYGLLPRGIYGQYDLSMYNARYAKEWGTPGVGCPSSLLAEAHTHLFINVALIQGSNKYEQARDVICNGGVIVTGSNQLFSSHRDADGFCAPQGHGGHCVYFRGVSDNARRPGICYQQSWGIDIPSGGPMPVTLPSGKSITLPAGCFFIDAEVFERMHAGGDSEVWSLTAEDGFLTPDEKVQFKFY